MEQTNVSKGQLWAGRLISTLVLFPFVMGLVMGLSKPEMVAQGMEHMGIPPALGKPLMVVEAITILLYAIPQTAVLGAILLAGYMGGAIMVHLRLGEPVYLQIALGVLAWLGLYLREPRLRGVFPLRR